MKSFLPKFTVLLALLALFSPARGAEKGGGTLDIYWIDSEGGGSTLIVTPEGESVLVDAGNPGERDSARIHKVATQVAGLKRIDHVIITHFHVDHFGGLADLAALMQKVVSEEVDVAAEPTFSAGLKGFLALCLVKEPARRAPWATLLQHPWLGEGVRE